MKKAIVAFSGDPITYGHIDIIDRALKVFDHVTVGIGVNPDKKYTFDLSTREEMAKRVLKKYGRHINVQSFKGLLIDFAYEKCIGTIIRGVRNSSDVDYEKILHEVNRSQELGIDTYVLFADQKLSHVSSSAVKELQKYHARELLQYVPLLVKSALEQTISEQCKMGITGEIGAGKSYVARRFVDLGTKNNISVHNIELDNIGHYILEQSDEPIAKKARKDLITFFGDSIKKGNFIDRKKLGKLLWNRTVNIGIFNDIMTKPIMLQYRRELTNKTGLILVNSALIAEADISEIVNNDVLIVEASKEVKHKRLAKRGYSKKEIEDRIMSQYDTDKKQKIINNKIKFYDYGHILRLDNSLEGKVADERIVQMFNTIISGFEI